MRKGIEIDVSATDCARLEAIVADRNSPQGIPPVGAAVRRLVLKGVL